MAISSQQEYERAIQEMQRLRDAPDDSPDGQRRLEIDAEIRMYALQNMDESRPAKPDHTRDS
ncbi:MAG TPA: hypothetical protein VED40_15860 [Azospirillaceae bacterium]|jgi:hypothetical protein|nr:hypothetical protein [Azospirillaceae bacterium]